MKLLYTVLLVLLFAACKDNYKPVDYSTPVDTSHWENQYTYAGVIPTSQTPNNALIGTEWVLVKMVSGFSTSFPYDTLRFLTNNTYSINSGSALSYQLTSGVASTNKTLTLYYFTPFGGSHYAGEVGANFILDGVINNAEFKNIQNSTDRIKAWFLKN